MPSLLETMAQRVEAECEGYRQEAQAEADGITAAARERAQAHYDEGVKRAESQIALQRKRAEDLAHGEAEKRVLAAQHAIAEDVLWSVADRLNGMATQDDFGNLVEALLAEAVAASSGDIVVVAPHAHVDRCQSWLSSNGREGVPVEGTDEFNDGIAVQDPARTYRITNTLSSRYAKFEPIARKRVMSKLFAEGA